MHIIVELLESRVWIYQRWNQKRNSNKDRQCSGKRKEEKNKKNKTMIQIILQGILKIEQHEPHMKSGGEFRCSGMVSCSFSISDDHHVTLYLSRCQVMTWNKSTRTKIKRPKNRTIQARTNTSSDTRSIALISITTPRSSGTLHVHSQLSFICSNHIFDVIVSVLASGAVDHGLEPRSVKPKTIKLVFVASPLSMQH
jgi:hypothetical protein